MKEQNITDIQQPADIQLNPAEPLKQWQDRFNEKQQIKAKPKRKPRLSAEYFNDKPGAISDFILELDRLVRESFTELKVYSGENGEGADERNALYSLLDNGGKAPLFKATDIIARQLLSKKELNYNILKGQFDIIAEQIGGILKLKSLNIGDASHKAISLRYRNLKSEAQKIASALPECEQAR